MDAPAVKVTYPIGVKLVTIITILILVSLGAITALVSVLVSRDLRITAEETNFTVNSRSASEAETALGLVRSNVLTLLDILQAVETGSAAARETQIFFFERNQNIAFIGAAASGGNGGTESLSFRLLNDRFFSSNELEISLVETFLSANAAAAARSCRGETLLLDASPVFGVPLLALLYPWQGSGAEEAAVVLFSPESLADTFGTGANESFMVNGDGDPLIRPGGGPLRAGANLGDEPFVAAMIKSPERSFQTLYTDGEGRRWFAAFTKLSLAGAAVITRVEYEVVFEGIAATTRRNVFLTGAVLCAAVLFIWFFSKTISRPLSVLSGAAERIETGEFDLDLRTKSRDEIGFLTESFVRMGRGLRQFGRFTNMEVARMAMKGELALGGEDKNVTIFFSDIRSFTAISEKLEPQEVVEFLNDYMTRMVDCVNKTGGAVDKFIGDAVMADWGAVRSAGSPGEDALNCVRSALLMRAALLDFNKGRGGIKKPVIRIGCGINSGSVVAGQIGSTQKMEYTVIGDAVNLASRTESMNKDLHTDILITEYTWNLIRDSLIVKKMGAATVKGKEERVGIFAVINMKAEAAVIKDGGAVYPIPGAGAEGPRTLEEVQELLGIQHTETGTVNLDAKEVKAKIE
ncbi:MAG: adenylate/guanylate cyclase domain-containing protein [Treponema sp.]|nr:adenylate/guanylate cyclase domain-containing protein [Treponema sp.]